MRIKPTKTEGEENVSIIDVFIERFRSKRTGDAHANKSRRGTTVVVRHRAKPFVFCVSSIFIPLIRTLVTGRIIPVSHIVGSLSMSTMKSEF